MNHKIYEVKVYADGTKYWYLNGKRHNENGPAVEWAEGHREWYNHGKLHNENGPAVVWADGDKEYWLNGKQLTEQEWKEQTNRTSCADKVIEVEGKKYKLIEL